MHAAVRHQSQQMQRAVGIACFVNRISEDRILEEALIRNGIVDTYQILTQDLSATQRDMPDLGVAHLTDRQTDRGAGGFQYRMRMVREILIQLRGARLLDRVVGFTWIDAESVQDDQDSRASWGA